MPETQAPEPQVDILRRIVATKRAEVEALRPKVADLRARAADAEPTRGFGAALAGGGDVSVIAEIKRRSPGAGDIRPGLNPALLARRYQSAGAAALSVLTDEGYFGGALSDLRAARAAVTLPVLRKDFTVDPLQVDEARAAGADAVLLIVRILSQGLLTDLHGRARELGMSALVEVHDAEELDRALSAGAHLVGINNRDLRTFRTDLAVTEGLLAGIPPTCSVVSESGIREGADVARLGEAGVDAVLVGESLLREPDPGAKVEELRGHARGGRPDG